MTQHPISVVTDGILTELADNLAVDLVLPPARRQHIETCVQMLMAHNPKATPKGLYYMAEDTYNTLPGKELHDTLERVAAASCAKAMREQLQ